MACEEHCAWAGCKVLRNAYEKLLKRISAYLPPRTSTGENVATAATTKTPTSTPTVCVHENTAHDASTQNAIFALAATYTQSENLCWSRTKSMVPNVGMGVAAVIPMRNTITGSRFTASTHATHTTGAHGCTNRGATNQVTSTVANTFAVAPAFTTAGKWPMSASLFISFNFFSLDFTLHPFSPTNSAAHRPSSLPLPQHVATNLPRPRFDPTKHPR
jgi:hypothetical protein